MRTVGPLTIFAAAQFDAGGGSVNADGNIITGIRGAVGIRGIVTHDNADTLTYVGQYFLEASSGTKIATIGKALVTETWTQVNALNISGIGGVFVLQPSTGQVGFARFVPDKLVINGTKATQTAGVSTVSMYVWIDYPDDTVVDLSNIYGYSAGAAAGTYSVKSLLNVEQR